MIVLAVETLPAEPAGGNLLLEADDGLEANWGERFYSVILVVGPFEYEARRRSERCKRIPTAGVRFVFDLACGGRDGIDRGRHQLRLLRSSRFAWFERGEGFPRPFVAAGIGCQRRDRFRRFVGHERLERFGLAGYGREGIARLQLPDLREGLPLVRERGGRVIGRDPVAVLLAIGIAKEAGAGHIEAADFLWHEPVTAAGGWLRDDWCGLLAAQELAEEAAPLLHFGAGGPLATEFQVCSGDVVRSRGPEG